MKIALLSAALLFSSLLLLSCKKDNPVIPPEPPPVDYRKITLSAEGKSCTEIWLRITADSVNLPSAILLKRNNIPLPIILTNTSDTVVYFDSLQPGTSFSFNAVLVADTALKSNAVSVNTLTPTNHNFSYQTWEYGVNFNQSLLYDVAIIDENNIWAVGEIYIADTSSLGYTKYNALHWNGIDWGLKKIYFPTVCGSTNQTPYPASAVFPFENDRLWISSSGDKIAILQSGVQIEQFCMPSLLEMSNYKIWGAESNELFITGTNGSIAYYLNGNWSKLASGTDLDLVDIYSRDNNIIYVAGINVSQVKGVVLKGNHSGFSVMINSEIITEDELFDKLYGDLASVWVDENGTVYAGGNLLYCYKNNKWNYVTSLPENYIGGNPGSYYRGAISSIRGNGSNDYIIAGERNTLKHFNGIDWEQIGLPYDASSPMAYGEVEQKGDVAVAVGYNGSKAFIILLNR